MSLGTGLEISRISDQCFIMFRFWEAWRNIRKRCHARRRVRERMAVRWELYASFPTNGHDRISLRPTYSNNVCIIMRRSQNYRPLRERHRVAVLRNRVTPLSVLSLAHVCRRPCNRFSFINNAHTKFYPLRIMIFIIYDYEQINNYLYLRRRKKEINLWMQTASPCLENGFKCIIWSLL